MDNENKNMVEAQSTFSYEVEATVLPLLNRLKETYSDPEQSGYLINILETNLKHLVNSYGNPNGLSEVYRRLSPVESLVVSMLRQGHSTKTIAQSLSITPGTVNIHRKHIRKKLGLYNKAINLESYLKSLVD